MPQAISSETVSELVRDAVVSTWSTTLNLPVDPHAADEPHADPAAVPVASTIAACVQVGHAWLASIHLRLPAALARILAAAMLGMGGDELGDGEVDDATGELANIIGGHLKSRIAGSSAMTPPVVIRGAIAIATPGTVELCCCRFACQGHALLVTVLVRS